MKLYRLAKMEHVGMELGQLVGLSASVPNIVTYRPVVFSD